VETSEEGSSGAVAFMPSDGQGEAVAALARAQGEYGLIL
jgi:hypothetical protein